MLATVTAVEGEAEGRTALAAKLVVRADGRRLGTLGDAELDRIATRDALAALDRGVTVTRHYGPHGEARREEVAVFIEVFAPPARLVMFGAVDFTRALVEVGKVLGYRGHGLRRPAGLRDQGPLPARRRGRRRVAGPLPGPDRRRARAARRRLRAHPRHEVRRARHPRRPADPGRLPRRHGLAAHARARDGSASSRRAPTRPS